MTPKLARFVDERVFGAAPESTGATATPCLIVDLDRVAENYRALKRALPLARIYYAVKANPAAPVLARLAALGSSFDAASYEEIAACLAAGAAPASISYGNTIKKAKAIRAAYAAGVDLFAFDSREELVKLAANAPGARVYCRVMVENSGAEWPLSRKFGADLALARTLMLEASALGLDPCGLSFHVGSQQTRTEAYEAAIGRVAMLFTDLTEAGVNLRMVNVGGGLPVRYRDAVPSIEDFAGAIVGALKAAFGNRLPEMVIEPGRALVADAGIVASEVVLVSRRSAADPLRWVYLDIGRFGGLAETENEAIRYRVTTEKDGGPAGPVAIAGPTCDGADILYEKTPYRLPLDLAAGDRVLIHATGAYVATYASQRFNGFAPLAEYYL